jgi:hypothetical protein
LHDCSYIRVRVSRKDQEVTANAIESIRPFVRLDQELWRIAEQRLDDLLMQHFGSTAAVEKQVRVFRRRRVCAAPRLGFGRGMHFLRQTIAKWSSFKPNERSLSRSKPPP